MKRGECGLCRQLGHSAKNCPKRRPARICRLCASLSHRVIGLMCKVCRLRYAPESNGDT